jgi:hypothetical protein
MPWRSACAAQMSSRVTIAFERALSGRFLQGRYMLHHELAGVDIMMPYDIASTHEDYTFAR